MHFAALYTLLESLCIHKMKEEWEEKKINHTFSGKLTMSFAFYFCRHFVFLFMFYIFLLWLQFFLKMLSISGIDIFSTSLLLGIIQYRHYSHYIFYPWWYKIASIINSYKRARLRVKRLNAFMGQHIFSYKTSFRINFHYTRIDFIFLFFSFLFHAYDLICNIYEFIDVHVLVFRYSVVDLFVFLLAHFSWF